MFLLFKPLLDGIRSQTISLFGVMTLAIALAFFFAAVSVCSAYIDCYDGQFYIREDPISCRHFYKCDNGNPVRFTCPGNLYYNPSLHVCDWPRNVRCKWTSGAGSGNTGGQQYGNSAAQQYTNNGHSSANYAPQNNNNHPSNQNKVNNGQQYSNNAAQNNNKYPSDQNKVNNGQQYANNGHSSANNAALNNGQQHSKPSVSYDEYDNLYDDMYPTPSFNPGYSGNSQSSDVGPSVQDPLGALERPRPIVDQLYTNKKHPYQEYLGEGNIDIRK